MRLQGRPKYVILKRVYAQKTTAQIRFYRAKRDFLEGEYNKRFALGESDINYAHKVGISAAGKTGDIREEEQKVLAKIKAWTKNTFIAVAYDQALEKYRVAVEAVKNDSYLTLTEDQLQTMVGGITEGLPPGSSKGRCRE